MKLLNEIKISDLLKEIYSDKYDWGGYEHGDTESKYQARKCIQTALVLIVTSRIIEMEDDLEDILDGKKDPGISAEQAKDLFYDHIRHLSNQYKGESATGDIRFDYIPNLYKLVATYLPEKNTK